MGIFGKLITGPLFRIIEDKSFHIFQPNDVWNEVVKNIELSKDSKPLLGKEIEVPGCLVVKDEVYTELFKETGDPELDSLTEHCLRIVCCVGAILLHYQLED